MIKKIFISIRNNGDGSVYPIYFADEDCAFMFQTLDEEYGDNGSVCGLVIHSDSEITVDTLKTKEEYLEELEEEMNDEWTEEKRKNILRNAIALLKGTIQ